MAADAVVEDNKNMRKAIIIMVLLLALVTACSSTPTSNAVLSEQQMTIQVDIPCSGHASLITSNLYSIEGVEDVQYSAGHKFEITYNPAQTNENEILNLDVFNTYSATKL